MGGVLTLLGQVGGWVKAGETLSHELDSGAQLAPDLTLTVERSLLCCVTRRDVT